SSGGLLGGTPSTGGSFIFSAEVTDSSSGEASQQFSLAIASGQDFALVTNYNYAPASANANLSVPIATACVNGFSGAIEFTAVNYNSQYGQLLAGYPQFSSWSIPCGASSTLTIPVYPGAQPGNYNVTVTAQATIDGQNVQHSA